VKRIALWFVLPPAALALLVWGYVPVRDKFTFLHHQSRCMAFDLPAATVAYTEDPAAVARLTGGAASGGGWATALYNGKSVAYYLAPRSLVYLEQSGACPIPQGTGPVFLHARRSRSGPQRLVVVKTDVMRNYRLVRSDIPDHLLDVSVVWPATTSSRANLTRSLWQPPGGSPDFGTLTLYAGRPDSADESHFTIDYQTPDGRGTIDGWLQPDDTVKLQVRDGPLAR
jgi:hypothetical protein